MKIPLFLPLGLVTVMAAPYEGIHERALLELRQDTTTSTSSSATATTSSVTTLAASSNTTASTVSNTTTSSASSAAATSAVSNSTSCNSASDRSVWCDYSIDTDYENVVPDTGVTREYWLDLTQVTIAPDGVSRTAMVVNGSLPGPTIFADWGDNIIVHVTNSLTESLNGTSIHWHGIRQNLTNQNDGVPSITQCPTAPGETYTYSFRATQYGSSWYHSHFSLQAWEGIFGGIVINGPATADYDEDLGNLFLQDWSHQTADELYIKAQTNGIVTLDTGLINGTNVFGTDGSSDQTGSRFSTTFESGTSYRLRLVNVAIDTHFKFSIDNHTMTVIANDFVPIVPYNTTVLNIAMGQRYDIIVTADQASVGSDFWIRAIPQTPCSTNGAVSNIKGVVHYGDSTGTPTTVGYTYTDECADELVANLVPHVSKTVGASGVVESEAVSVGLTSDSLFRWQLNGTSMDLAWGNPTLLQVSESTTSTFTNTSNVLTVPTANEWVYVLITIVAAVSHPIHMHGHDIYVLASGTGTYSSSTVTLNQDNPPRRDVVLLPAGGYLVLAFQTGNPGAWLMHCHIGWHTLEGFGLQFVEQASEIPALLDTDTLNSTCTTWNNYATTNSISQEDDSGI